MSLITATDSQSTQKDDRYPLVPVKLSKEGQALEVPTNTEVQNQNQTQTSFVLDTTPYTITRKPAVNLNPTKKSNQNQIFDQDTKHKMQTLELNFFQFKTVLDQFCRLVSKPYLINWGRERTVQFRTIHVTVDSIVKSLSKSLSREKSKLKMLELKVESTERGARIFEQRTEDLQIELDAWEEQFGAMFELFRLYIFSKNKQDLGEGLMLVENQIAALKDFFFFKLNRFTFKQKKLERAMTIEQKKYHDQGGSQAIWDLKAQNGSGVGISQNLNNYSQTNVSNAQYARSGVGGNDQSKTGMMFGKKAEGGVGLKGLLTETDLGALDYTQSARNIHDTSLAQDLVPNYNFNKNQNKNPKMKEGVDLHNMSNMLNNYKVSLTQSSFIFNENLLISIFPLRLTTH